MSSEISISLEPNGSGKQYRFVRIILFTGSNATLHVIVGHSVRQLSDQQDGGVAMCGFSCYWDHTTSCQCTSLEMWALWVACMVLWRNLIPSENWSRLSHLPAGLQLAMQPSRHMEDTDNEVHTLQVVEHNVYAPSNTKLAISYWHTCVLGLIPYEGGNICLPLWNLEKYWFCKAQCPWVYVTSLVAAVPDRPYLEDLISLSVKCMAIQSVESGVTISTAVLINLLVEINAW